jgi:hypothetical protein
MPPGFTGWSTCGKATDFFWRRLGTYVRYRTLQGGRQNTVAALPERPQMCGLSLRPEAP